eukprot:4926944-Amphidinium_carterae.3
MALRGVRQRGHTAAQRRRRSVPACRVRCISESKANMRNAEPSLKENFVTMVEPLTFECTVGVKTFSFSSSQIKALKQELQSILLIVQDFRHQLAMQHPRMAQSVCDRDTSRQRMDNRFNVKQIDREMPSVNNSTCACFFLVTTAVAKSLARGRRIIAQFGGTLGRLWNRAPCCLRDAPSVLCVHYKHLAFTLIFNAHIAIRKTGICILPIQPHSLNKYFPNIATF